jgi:tight adherence protein B
MNRGRRALLTLVASALIAVPTAAAEIDLTPVKRVPFPKRGYVVDIGRDAHFTHTRVHLSENGVAVSKFRIRPLAGSSINSAVVLAIDASDSMAGAPFKAALEATREFGSSRTNTERVGVVAFNDDVQILQAPTLSVEELGASLDKAPSLSYGTHIYDAVQGSLGLLANAKVATGTVIILSDGVDVGSFETLEEAIDAARRQGVRVFTVGLRSATYDPEPLRRLASETGGSYYEAGSAVELAPIYRALGDRLASQYLLEYRSGAIPRSAVILRMNVDGVGIGTAEYTAPKPSVSAPFHRSLFKRFVLSPFATVVISLLLALILGGVMLSLLRRERTGVVSRVEDFLHGVKRPAERLMATGENVRTRLASSPQAQSWLARLDRDLEIAAIDMRASRLVALTAAGTGLLCVLFALLSPVLVLLGLLVPMVVRGWIKRKLRLVRDEFADQLSANLQVLASAMRAGHSFNGSLAVVVENAHEPSRRELRRAVNDDQLGIPTDVAIRRVADRMDNRDLQQVALLSELQRTAGGNSAEVLDTVTDTIRERGEVRRLVQTLTAQGRMARWILTAVPAVAAFFLWLMQPELMNPLFLTTGGQIALVIAATMVACGSMMIQRIVEIRV